MTARPALAIRLATDSYVAGAIQVAAIRVAAVALAAVALAAVAVAAVAGGTSRVLAQAPLPSDSARADAPRADTTVLLDVGATVVVSRARLRPVGSTGATALTNELPGARSVAEALGEHGVHVREYGPGTLASVSARGGSSAQTLALWNGLPVANPTLGLIDWNLLSLAPDQRVTLTRGGHASAWGSGAVAATVHLEDLPPHRRGLATDVGLTAGAFGESGAELGVGYGGGGGRWAGTLRAALADADNDFAYAPAPGMEEVRLANAAQRRLNLRTGVYFRPRPSDELALHTWFQRATREIPPAVGQTRSAALQEDGATRVSLRYRRERERYRLAATAGYFVERLDYRDSLAGVDSESDFRIALAEATVALPLREAHTLTAGATARHTRATVDDAYAGAPTELAASGMAGYHYSGRRFEVQIDLRYGRAGDRSLGFTPALGLVYRLTDALATRARVSRDYRAPTFNDRYYQPGGNPDLLPERGWSTEVGFDLRRNGWHAALTAYRRRVGDWIMWGKLPDTRFFSAYNLTSVTSLGLEPRLSYRHSAARGQDYRIDLGYDLTRSTNDVAVDLPNIPAGQQLWYVPVHGGFATATLALGRVSARYTQRWRGPSLGINEDVAASTTGDLTLSLRRPWRGCELRAWLEVRNVFDVDYRLIERRPLPGRHVRGGLRVRID